MINTGERVVFLSVVFYLLGWVEEFRYYFGRSPALFVRTQSALSLQRWRYV